MTADIASSLFVGRCQVKDVVAVRPMPSRAARAGRRRAPGPTRRSDARRRPRGGIDAPSAAPAVPGDALRLSAAMFLAAVRWLVH